MDIYQDLKDNYLNKSAKFFAEKYGRSLNAIYTLASKLNLTKGPRRTKALSDRVLEEYYVNKLTITEIHHLLKIGKCTIGKILKEQGNGGRTLDECVYKRYECNDDYFEEIDTPEKAYWIGFIQADGNLYNKKLQIALHEKDKDHLEKLVNRLGYNGVLYNEKKKKTWKLIIARKKIFNDLKKHGVSEKKTLAIDRSILDSVKKELLPAFIHGYFDGDGSFAASNKTWIKKKCGGKTTKRYISLNILGNEDFLLGLSQIFTQIGIKHSGAILKDKRTKQTFSLAFRLSPERVAILKKFFYENEFSSQDFLQRKKDRLYSVTNATI